MLPTAARPWPTLGSGSLVTGVGAGVLTIAAALAAASTPLAVAGLLGLLVVVLACTFPTSLWNLVPLSVLVITPQVLSGDPDTPVPNGDAIQKLILLVALFGLVLTLGLRRSMVGTIALGVLLLSGAAAAVNAGGEIVTGRAEVLRAFVGFAVPWLFLFVDWGKLGLVRGLRFLTLLPTISLFVGLLMMAAGISAPVRREWSGALRLQGAAVPAHLAMLALIGVIAALLLLCLEKGSRSWYSILLPGLNLGILLGTATRGAIAVGASVVIVFIMASQLSDRIPDRGRTGAALLLFAGLAGSLLAAKQILMRNQGNAYEGTFNTSGREQAWNFFFDAGMANPVTGRGLGFSSIAVESLKPRNVQTAFIAPHNEYIHLFVDGGMFLAIGMLGSLAAALIVAIRAASDVSRAILVTFGIGIAFYSAIDNTLSAPQFSVTTLILTALVACGSREWKESVERPKPTTLTNAPAFQRFQ